MAEPRIRPLEEKIQYQGSTKGGRFDPAAIPNPNQGINAKLATINESFANMAKSGVDNIEAQSKQLQELSRFSQTLNESFQKGYEYYIKNEEEQANLQFEADTAARSMAALNADQIDNTIKEIDSAHQDTAYAALKQGAPVEVVESIKNLGGVRGYFYRRNAAKFAGEKFPEWVQDKLLNDSREITINGVTKAINDKTWGVPEHAAIIKKLVGEYFQESGLNGISRELQAKYALPKITEAQDKLMGIKRKEWGYEQSSRNFDDAESNFLVDKDLGSFLQRIANTYDQNGNPRLYAGAWKAAMNTLKQMFDVGAIDEEGLMAIEKQIDPVTGKTFGESRKLQFMKLREELQEENRKNYRDEEADLDIQFRDAEKQILEYFASNKPSQADVEAAEKDLFQKYGKTSSALNTLKSTYTIDAEAAKRLNTQFENLASQGLLTTEMVSKAPWEIQQKWMSVATKQAEASSMTGNFKNQIKAIENHVKNDPRVKVSPDGSTSGLATLVIGELQAKFRRKVAEYVGTGQMTPEQAAQQAVTEVMTEFTQGGKVPGSRYFMNSNGEFVNFLPKNAAQTSKALANKLNTIRTTIAATGKAGLDSPGLILNSSELKAIEKGYGESGWRVPPVVQYWAGQLRMNPLEIINRQRKAAGMKELATPAAIEATKGSVNPRLQQLLYSLPSPNRSTRALSSMKRFVPEIVPKGYGPTIQAAAKANGIDPAILAGLIETESSWNPKARSKAGARGIAQIMPQYHPGVDYDDPVASINYAAKHLKGLLAATGGDLNRAIKAYNGGMGGIDKSDENRRYLPKVLAAAAKYGYGQAWRDPATMRGKFRVIEYLSGDPNHSSSFDAAHSGSNYHDHIAFATTAERNAAIKKLKAAGIRVGSVDRPGDSGNHGKGLAIDIPGDQVPVGQEKELSRRVRSILGLR